MQRASTAYFQTQVTTTSQGDLVVMLYDGAIKFLMQAKQFLAANDMANKGIAISKALDVLNELDSSLNMEKGGDLSTNLHSLYAFCNNHLVKANIRKDANMIDEVLKVLTGLRGAYAEILALPEAQTASQSLAANMHASAILPSRHQAGTSPTGGATPAPGATARFRNSYAMAAPQQDGEAAQPVQTLTPPTPGKPAPLAAAMPGAAPSAPAVPKRPASTMSGEPAAQAPVPPAPAQAQSFTEPAVPVQQPPAPQEFPAAMNFARKQAGTNMYRKFAGQ